MKINAKKIKVSDAFIDHCIVLGIDIRRATVAKPKTNPDVEKIRIALQQLQQPQTKKKCFKVI